MRGLRIASLIVGAVALLACLGGVLVAGYYAPPADRYHIAGLVLRGEGSGVTLSHRSVACTDDAADPLATTCRATVAGRAVVVSVVHETPQRWGFTACSVSVGGAVVPCRGGSQTAGGPILAVADGGALGLFAADLASARSAHPIENWRESDWQRLPFLLALLAALALAVAGLNAPTHHWLGRAVVASAGALTAFVVAYGGLGIWILTLGYVD